jgi:GT2 family glycosyltransferase
MTGPLSVVLISKDEPALGDTLEALRASPHPVLPLDVVVVDASGGRLDDIRRRFPEVRWLEFRPPPGVATTIPHQRNAGVRAAAGDVVVFVDAGCIPVRGWLGRLAEPIVAGREAVVCGGVESTDGAPHYARNRDSVPDDYVEDCPTLNLAFRRDVFDAVGGFDESFAYGSDIDFAWRVRAAGHRIRFEPEAAVAHDWGGSGRQLRRAFRYGAARAHLYRKHPGRRLAALRDDPMVVGYPLFLLGLPLAARLRAYPLLLLVPLVRNRRERPLETLALHLAFGAGVLRELAGGARWR